MSERKLSIYTRSQGNGGIFKVELNGKRVSRVSAVSFSCDASDFEIEAAMVFRVDAVDLIEVAESMEQEPDDTTSEAETA